MDEEVAAALSAYRRFREDSLAATPLARMAEWVRTGAPPPAEALRRAGLATDSAGVSPERSFQLRMARKPFIADWGFSIPCAEAVAALRALGPLVEIGAGAGSWTALLRAAGCDVVATDPTASGDIGYGFSAGRCCEVEPLTAQAAVARYAGRDVFCSWPTQDASWALGAAWAMRPGRRLALIAEPRGGNAGSPGLFRYLDTRFRQLAEIAIPQFPGCRDRLTIHEKRG